MANLLIVDDDRELFSLLEALLEKEGFSCAHAPDSDSGRIMARNGSYDAVLLDVVLPEGDGFELLRCLRGDERTRDLPVLMLTGKGEEDDRVAGLEMGADDYLSKPFSGRELVARLRAVLRRAGSSGAVARAQSTQQLGDLSINWDAFKVSSKNMQAELTVSEARLLKCIVRNLGEVTPRLYLYETVFGHEPYPLDRSLDMLVSRLRKKLGPRPDGMERIKTVRGEGYVYLPPA